MSKRVAPLAVMLCVFALGGYASRLRSEPPVTFTSGELNSGSDDSDAMARPLKDSQLAALSHWFDAGLNCSRFSMNPPNEPSMQMHLTLRDASGENWRIDIYQRNNANTTAYIYKGQRVAPTHCALDNATLATLQSAS